MEVDPYNYSDIEDADDDNKNNDSYFNDDDNMNGGGGGAQQRRNNRTDTTTTTTTNHQHPDGDDGNDNDDHDEEERQHPLCILLESHDWAAVLSRVTQKPWEISHIVDASSQGRTPLHIACGQDTAPVSVIQCILKANPDATIATGTSNMTPLHILCSSTNASIHILRVLLECGRNEQFTMRDVDGDTPLHTACRCGATQDVLELLLYANPNAVHMRDYENLTPLLRLWVRYFVILGISEHEIENRVHHFQDLSGELLTAWNKTELLLRCAYLGRLDAPPTASPHHLLLPPQQHHFAGVVPTTATTANHHHHNHNIKRRFLPLHAVASIDCPRVIVKIATQLYGGTLLFERDEDGRTPLMVACSTPIFPVRDLSDTGYSLDDVIHEYDYTYNYTYTYNEHTDNNSNHMEEHDDDDDDDDHDQQQQQPEHNDNNQDHAAAAAVMDVRPPNNGENQQQQEQPAEDDAVMTNGTTSSNSSTATATTPTSPSVIEILLHAAQSTTNNNNAPLDDAHKFGGANLRDPSGRLPLHMALIAGKGWKDGVSELVNVYPAGVHTPDQSSKLYPYQLAASQNDLYTSFELLRRSPTVLDGTATATASATTTNSTSIPARSSSSNSAMATTRRRTGSSSSKRKGGGLSGAAFARKGKR